MRYVHTKYLNIGLKDLERRGGKFQRAAKSVYEILGKISGGDPGSDIEPFRGYSTTNYGEKRIKHCVKYDLRASVGC